jgi:hypothetical protein
MTAGVMAGVSAGGHVGVVSMTALRYAQADAGNVIMPVRPAQLIYANFKHIQVRPDSRLENGIPLYKLKILDTLIEQLSQQNKSPRSVDAGSIDSVIVEMSKGLRPEGSSGQAYRARLLPAPGAFVDLVA